MKRFTALHADALKERIFRLVALMLALMASSQILPVTLSGDASDIFGGEGTPILTVRPLQVCDCNLDVAGFLADHPWVPVSGAAPFFTALGIACGSPEGFYLPDGVHPAIFRPPRTEGS